MTTQKKAVKFSAHAKVKLPADQVYWAAYEALSPILSKIDPKARMHRDSGGIGIYFTDPDKIGELSSQLSSEYSLITG